MELVVSMQRFHVKDEYLTARCSFKIKTQHSICFSASESLYSRAQKCISPEYDNWFITEGIYIGGECVVDVDEENWISSDTPILYFECSVCTPLESPNLKLVEAYCNMITHLSTYSRFGHVVSKDKTMEMRIGDHLLYHSKDLEKDLAHLHQKYN